MEKLSLASAGSGAHTPSSAASSAVSSPAASPLTSPLGSSSEGPEGRRRIGTLQPLTGKPKSPAGSGDVLDSLLGGGKSGGLEPKKGSGDVLDSLVGGGGDGEKKVRPKPLSIETEEKHGHLSRVEEESSDVDEVSQSAGSPANPKTPASASEKSASAKSQSKLTPLGSKSQPSESPQSAVAPVPLDSPGSGTLEGSVSSAFGNEVSLGGDYSVEDSLELEKCADFVEAVRPMGPLMKQVAASKGGKSPTDAQTGIAGAGLAGSSSAATRSPGKAKGPSADKGDASASKDASGGEYDESFGSDSVPESIEESIGSGSGSED